MSVTLVYVPKGQPLDRGVAVFDVDKDKKTVKFHDQIIVKMMSETGIIIPAIEQPAYGNKVKVVLGDPEFYKAFTQLYLANHYTDKEQYKWCKTSK